MHLPILRSNFQLIVWPSVAITSHEENTEQHMHSKGRFHLGLNALAPKEPRGKHKATHALQRENPPWTKRFGTEKGRGGGGGYNHQLCTTK